MEKEKFVGDLILLRGLPGCGKSTVGEVILTAPSKTPDVLSVDDFFMNNKGKYVFNPDKLKEAQNDCQLRCAEKMKHEIKKIVVANTFTDEYELSPYFEMAKRYNYRVHTLIVENRHGSENTHNIQEDKIEELKEKFHIKLN